MSESVTFTLDGDAAKLLAALSDSEQGFRGLETVIKSAIAGSIPDLEKFAKGTEQLAPAAAFEQADRYAKAVEAIGGAAALTAPDLARVNAVLADAITAYETLGTTAPQALTQLQTEVQSAGLAMGLFSDSATQADADISAAFAHILDGMQGVAQASSLEELNTGVKTAADALEALGGVSVLTASQQSALGENVDALAARYAELGQGVPESLTQIQQGLQETATAALAASASTDHIFEGASTTIDATSASALSLSDALLKVDGAPAAASLDAVGKAAQAMADASTFEAAQRYADAVERIGGAARLTEPELARVNAVLDAALDRYAELGSTGPQALTALQAEVQQARTTFDAFGNAVVMSADQAAKAFDTLLQGLTALEQVSVLDNLTAGVKQASLEIEQMGGVAKLTAEQQAGLADGVDALADTYQRLGQDVPKDLTDIQEALDALVDAEAKASESADTLVEGMDAATTAADETASAANTLGESWTEVEGASTDASAALTDVGTAADETGTALDDTAGSGESLDEALRAIDGGAAAGQLHEVSEAADDVEASGQQATLSLKEMFLAMAAGSAGGQIAVDALHQVGDAARDIIGAVPKMVTGVADMGDHFRDLSLRTGVSVESLSLFDYVAGQTGVSLETLARSVTELGKNLSDTGTKSQGTRNALLSMGLSFDELKKQKPEDAFVQIIEKLGTLDTGLRNQLGTEIFGGKFRMMSNLTKEDIAGLMKEADALGLKFGTDLANKADAFNDALNRMEKMIQATKNSIGGALLTPLTALLEKLPLLGGGFLLAGEAAIGASEKLLEMSGTIVLVIANWGKVTEAAAGVLPWFAKVAASGGALGTVFTTVQAAGAAVAPVLAAVGTVLAPLLIATGVAAALAALAFGLVKVWDAVTGLYSAIQDGKVIAFLTAKEDDTWARRLLGLSGGIKEVTKATEELAAEKPYDSYDKITESVVNATAAVEALTDEQRKNIEQALKAGMKPADIQAATHREVDVDTINEINRLRELTDAQNAAEAKLAADRLARGKTGLAAALANQAAQQQADIEAVNNSVGKADEKEQKLAIIVAKGASERATLLYDAEKQTAAQLAQLETQSNQQRIKDEQSGLQQQLAMIAERERAEIESIRRSGSGQEVAQINAAKIKAAIDTAEAMSAARKKGEDRDLEIANEAAESRIRIEKDGIDRQIALIDLGVTQKIAAAGKSGMLEQQLADESVRITEQGEIKKNELRANLQKKADEEMLALTRERTDREIDLTKIGMDREEALEEAHFANIVRLAGISGESIEAKQLAHEDRMAEIRRKGDEVTVQGIEHAIAAAQQELDAMEKNGATYATLASQREKVNDLQIKGAQSLAEANELRYEQERQRLLDIINDEEQSVQARMEARKKLIALDVEHAVTEKEGRVLKAAEDMALYKEMAAHHDQWSDSAIAAQHRVAEASAKAAEGVKQDWLGTLGGLTTAFGKLAGMSEGTFGTVAAGVGQAGAALQEMSKMQGKDAVSQWSAADTAGGKATAVLGGATAAIEGVSEMNSATDVAGAGNRMLGGALSGAKTGMMIAGPYGAAAGAVVGLLVGAFRHPDFEKAMNDVGERYGVDISEGLARQISKDAKENFAGSHIAAELNNMTAIIKEAGGLDDDNFAKFTSNLRDVFVLVGQGKIAGEQAVEILDKNFGAFAQHVLESGKVADAGFAELFRLNAQAQEQSQQMIDFVTSQAGVASNAIAAMIAPIAKASEELATLKEKRDALAADKSAGLADGSIRPGDSEFLRIDNELVKANLELHNKRVEVLGEESTKSVELLEKEQTGLAELLAARERLVAAGRSTTEVDAQIAAVTQRITELKDAGAGTFPEIDRAARLMAATFNAATADGVGLLEAVDALGPGLDTLIKTYENLGVSIEGSAVAELASFRDRINNNRDLVESADAVNQVMKAMSNIGALNADTFKDLQAQGVDTYNKLRAAGFAENEALTMEKGFLENVREAHIKLKLPIDANTQALIDQAEQQGILADDALSTNGILMEGLGAIIEAVGGKLPDAFRKFKDAATGTAKDAGDALKSNVGDAIDVTGKKVADGQMWNDFAAKAKQSSLDAATSIGTNLTSSMADANLQITDPQMWDALQRQAAEASRAAGLSLSGDLGSGFDTATDAIGSATPWDRLQALAAKAAAEASQSLGTDLADGFQTAADIISSPTPWDALETLAASASAAAGTDLDLNLTGGIKVAQDAISDASAWTLFQSNAEGAAQGSSDALQQQLVDAMLIASAAVGDPLAWDALLANAESATTGAGEALQLHVTDAADAATLVLIDPAPWDAFQANADGSSLAAGQAIEEQLTAAMLAAGLSIGDAAPWDQLQANAGLSSSAVAEALDGAVGDATEAMTLALTDDSAWTIFQGNAEDASAASGVAITQELTDAMIAAGLSLADAGPWDALAQNADLAASAAGDTLTANVGDAAEAITVALTDDGPWQTFQANATDASIMTGDALQVHVAEAMVEAGTVIVNGEPWFVLADNAEEAGQSVEAAITRHLTDAMETGGVAVGDPLPWVNLEAHAVDAAAAVSDALETDIGEAITTVTDLITDPSLWQSFEDLADTASGAAGEAIQTNLTDAMGLASDAIADPTMWEALQAQATEASAAVGDVLGTDVALAADTIATALSDPAPWDAFQANATLASEAAGAALTTEVDAAMTAVSTAVADSGPWDALQVNADTATIAAGDALEQHIAEGFLQVTETVKDGEPWFVLETNAEDASTKAGESIQTHIVDAMEAATVAIGDPLPWVNLQDQAEAAATAVGTSLETQVADAATTVATLLSDAAPWDAFQANAEAGSTAAGDAIEAEITASMIAAGELIADPTPWDAMLGIATEDTTAAGDAIETEITTGIDAASAALTDSTPWDALLGNATESSTTAGDTVETELTDAMVAAGLIIADPEPFDTMQATAEETSASAAETLETEISDAVDAYSLKVADTTPWDTMQATAEETSTTAGDTIEQEITDSMDASFLKIADTTAWRTFAYSAATTSDEAANSVQSKISAGMTQTERRLSDTAGWDRFLLNAITASGAVVKEIEGEVYVTVDGVTKKLKDTDWRNWGINGYSYAEMARVGLSNVSGAAYNVQSGLNSVNWGGFAAAAQSAAATAQAAINKVSFGSSPGGIKEIPIQLGLAIEATNEFARLFSMQMRDAKQTVDQLGDASLIEMQANLQTVPEMTHEVVHTVTRDTSRETEAVNAQQAMLDEMLAKIQDIAEMPTTVIEAGAIQNTLQAWGIADRKDIERAMADATLARIAGNDGGLLARFEKVVRRVPRR